MVVEKFLVDSFSAAKAFFDSMPVPDGRLSKFPAKQHNLAAVVGWEIHEPDVEVLYLAPELVNVLDGLVEPGGID